MRRFRNIKYLPQIGVVVGVAILGTWALVASHGATPAASVEAESGNLTTPASSVQDSTASGNAAVKFGTQPANINSNGVGVAVPLAYLSDADRTSKLNSLKDLGVTWVRIDIEWNNVEPTNNGVYNWASYDTAVNAIQSYGMKVDAIIDYTATWNETAGCTSYLCQPADINAYATYAQAVVSHFGNKLGAVEIWNEPDLAQFWQPQPNPTVYSNMLKLAYTAIKSVDPSMLVLSGGLSPSSNNSTNGNIWAATFLTDMYADGDKDYFDALGYHPYSYPDPPSQYQVWSGWDLMAQTPTNLRAIMTANGDVSKRIWITEVGAPTNGPGVLTTCADAAAGTFPTGTDHVDTCLQSQIDSEAITLSQGYSWAGPVFLYTLKDSGTDTSTKENFFGLIDYNGNQKPSYSAVKTAISGLQ